MKEQQMNVYARFIAEEPRLENAPEPAKPARRNGTRVAARRSPKPGLKKRAGLPK